MPVLHGGGRIRCRVDGAAVCAPACHRASCQRLTGSGFAVLPPLLAEAG